MSLIDSGGCYYDSKLRERPDDWWNPELGIVVGIDLTGDCARVGVQKLKDGLVHIIADHEEGICVPQAQLRDCGVEGELGLPSVDFNEVVRTLSRLKLNADVYLKDNITSAMIAVPRRLSAHFRHSQKLTDAFRLAGFTNTSVPISSVASVIESFTNPSGDLFLGHDGTRDVNILLVDPVKIYRELNPDLLVDISLIEILAPDWGASSIWKNEAVWANGEYGVVQAVESVLQTTEMPRSMVDMILITGSHPGMTGLQTVFQEHFPDISRIVLVDSDEHIVTGAAMMAGRLGHQPSQFEGLVCSQTEQSDPEIKSNGMRMLDMIDLGTCPFEDPLWASPLILDAQAICDVPVTFEDCNWLGQMSEDINETFLDNSWSKGFSPFLPMTMARPGTPA
ncbi:hypothetical protein NP233_g4042 [Leucocoprinus birnbaumii]|uniref:Uncharacterized protein n=1 Tax=Leucocoprinus birnbaumii TaxID=56174 RepID=A0AAD5VXZ4_9AGAR|nr:hypothetical protein NP233_g4042 [Leucocoprinus birnbaumii]